MNTDYRAAAIGSSLQRATAARLNGHGCTLLPVSAVFLLCFLLPVKQPETRHAWHVAKRNRKSKKPVTSLALLSSVIVHLGLKPIAVARTY